MRLPAGEADGDSAVIPDADGPPIRTPDQRLRVFVSSTMRELQAERRAVRAAIEGLRLAPVMFELGARPHPPRRLYRAYLTQSDVFIGIYGQEYGWVAPGEALSGLEDEYRLVPPDMPKLIYVLDTAERQERLDRLIDRIRDDDTASYTPFGSAQELAALVEADLATLLAERFDASRRDDPPPASDSHVSRLPMPYSEAVGREAEVATLLDWLADDRRRLITLAGPGGMGKSRLAIEVVRQVGDPFDAVTFVMLEQVREASDVVPAIARELGVRGVEHRPVSEQLERACADRRDLIVLDNFEQVMGAARDIVSLLDRLPGATFLVTSRARLRVRGEHVFDVEPLGLPPHPSSASLEEVLASPAVRLFRDRSRAADPRFEVTAENAADVARLCCALEGVPLSIELASARIRALTPAALLARLDRVMPLLVTAARDLPERQRTIRATVEWSVDLLGDDARALFARLGVFAGDFSLEAAEAVTAGEPWAGGMLEVLLELVDGSLLRQLGEGEVPLFSMLTPVRELAAARFASDPRSDTARRAHADFYVRLAGDTEARLRGRTQLAALDRLECERDNIRAAYRWLLEIGEVDAVADALWNLFLYWWICDLMLEAKTWAQGLTERANGRLSPRTRAIALMFPMWVSLWQAGTEIDPQPFEEAVEIFGAAGDEMDLGVALTVLALGYMSASDPDLDRAEKTQRAALALEAIQRDPPYRALFRGALGRILLLRGEVGEATRLLEESQAEAARAGDPFIESVALTQLGWALLAAGDPRPDAFVRNLELAVDLRNDNGVAFALEGLTATALVSGDIERAGTLFGAAEALRARSGLADQRSYVTFQPYVEAVFGSDQGPAFQAARARGARMPRAAVIEAALDRSSRTRSG